MPDHSSHSYTRGGTVKGSGSGLTRTDFSSYRHDLSIGKGAWPAKMEINNNIEYPGAENIKRIEATSPVDPQASVNSHFQSAASDWERIYHAATVDGRIYQDRMAIALRWVEQLSLPRTADLLEIGCGAGFATAALAKRGYRIDALDSVPAMIDLTRKRLDETGAAERVRMVLADVRHLPMADNSFDLVFALGVLPWLDDPVAAVREMVRVTRPGGHVLFSADNSVHLDEILDPARAPIIRPLRRRLASALRAAKLLSLAHQSPKIQRHSRREIDCILSEAGLDKLRSVMLGFGPFTICGKSFLPESVGIKVHQLLQAAANRELPIVSFYGMQYLVMSKKTARVQ
jgi:ubiquinone/menaquinone biosynthesis C-methylase UbiE